MKYDAFISYRHLYRDMYVAKKLHKGLETIKIPKKLRKELGRKRINRVFRDQEELPVVSDLGANITAALSESDYLIVICSPKTKESAWVMKEIDTFIEMHGREHILTVLVDGEPDESFPPQLLIDKDGNSVEPLAADVRGDTRKEVNKKLRTETIRLAAAILGVDYDDLKRRQRERVVKRNMIVALCVAALGFAIAAFSGYNLARVNQEYQQKLINESKVIAAKSKDVLETGDRKAATLIAMEGMPIDGDRPLVPESMFALSQALGVYTLSEYSFDETHLNTVYNVKSISSNIDSKYATILDENGNVYVWDVSKDEKLYEIRTVYEEGVAKKVLEICFTEKDNILAIVYEDMIRGYDIHGELVYEYKPEHKILSAEISWIHSSILIEYAENNEDKYPDTIAVIRANDGKERGVFKTDSDNPYSFDAAIDWTEEVIAVGHVPKDGVENYVSVYNLYGGSEYDRTIPITNDTIVSMGFVYTDEWDLGLIISSAPKEVVENDMEYLADVQYYNFEKDAQTWTNQLTYYQFSDNHGEYQIEPVNDEKTEYFQQSLISAGKAMYFIDNATGEILDKGKYDSYINKVFSAGSLIFTLNNAGIFRLYAFDTGLENPCYGKKLTDNMSMLGLVKGYMIVASDDISYAQVLGVENAKYYKKEVTFDEKIAAGSCSPNGEYYYVVTQTADDGSREVIVLSSENHKEIDRFVVEDGYGAISEFYDNDTIVVQTANHRYYFYSIEKGTTEIMESDSVDENVSETYSNGLRYVVEFGHNFADVYNLDVREKCYHYDFDYTINLCAVSNEGDFIYALDNDGAVHFIDLYENQEEIFKADYGVIYVVVSPDGKYIAISCDDNKLRIVDTESLKEVAAFDFASSGDGYTQFSSDGKYLITHSSNRIFKIYDVEENKMVFVSDEISDEIYRMRQDETSGLLSVITGSGMYLIDLNDIGILAYVQDGRTYLPGKKEVISTYVDTVYVFDYMDADDLIEEVHNRYGDARLTDEQKLLYGIGI